MVAGVCYSAELVGVLSMSDKASIWVIPQGNEIRRVLAIDNKAVREFSYLDTIDLIDRCKEALKEGVGIEIAEGQILTPVETITLAMNAFSALRYSL